MTQPIGIRLPDDVLKSIDSLSGNEDRSTLLRTMILIGLSEYKKRKAAERYKEGLITLSEASAHAGITLWEMEQYLVLQGYKSEYSIEDLEEEVEDLE
jgi:predicted HTH domain antitoxin